MKVVRWMGDLRHCSKARPTGLTGAGPCFRMAQIDGGMPAGEASHVQCASEASKLRGPFPSGLFFGWAACGTLSVMGRLPQARADCAGLRATSTESMTRTATPGPVRAARACGPHERRQ